MALLLIYFLLAIGISFMCSILEAVLFSVTPAFIESYLKTNPKSGKTLQFLKTNIDNAIGAILIVNLFANTLGASGVGVQATKIFGEAWQGAVAFGMTLSVLYIAEILPKTIGALYWKQLILPACYITFTLYWISFPLVYISHFITRLFTKDSPKQMSRDEVLAVMELGQKSGSINELEASILTHLITQKQLKTKDIMTPKAKIFALSEDMSVKEALKAMNGYSRIPLYDSHNGISRMVYAKHIFKAKIEGKKKLMLKDIAREIPQVKGELPLLPLLKRFIHKKEHLFAVLNEQELIGIVSLDDVSHAILNVGDTNKKESQIQ